MKKRYPILAGLAGIILFQYCREDRFFKSPDSITRDSAEDSGYKKNEVSFTRNDLEEKLTENTIEDTGVEDWWDEALRGN